MFTIFGLLFLADKTTFFSEKAKQIKQMLTVTRTNVGNLFLFIFIVLFENI
jgi:hypothetical protein